MLEKINNEVPILNEQDKIKVYNYIISKKEEKRNIFLNKKFSYSFFSILLVFILAFTIIKIYDNDGNKPKPPYFPDSVDIDNTNELISIGNGLLSLEFYDCYRESTFDVLTLYVADIATDTIFIKSFNSDLKITDIRVKDYDNIITFNKEVYAINSKDLNYIYLDIYFESGTFEKNLIINESDNEKNVSSNGEVIDDVATSKSELTLIKFYISPLDESVGFEEVVWAINYENINEEAKIFINGKANSFNDAFNMVDISALLYLNNGTPQTITYHKNNKISEIEVFYSYNGDDINIYAINLNKIINIKEFAEEYIDTNLFVYEKTENIINNNLQGDYYLCYKNEEDMKLSYIITFKEYNDITNYYIISFELFGENVNDFEKIISDLDIIYK